MTPARPCLFQPVWSRPAIMYISLVTHVLMSAGRFHLVAARMRKLTKAGVISEFDAIVDGMGQPRKVDRYHHEQRDQRSPVDAIRVSIDATVLVQHGGTWSR
jgi:hypothetical protein